jgi:ornithine cyclodeaminase/alanine dehydrogenase-like protein (mu-crystallin family)
MLRKNLRILLYSLEIGVSLEKKLDTLIVGSEEVKRLLPMESCIATMKDAMIAFAKGEVVLPQRQALRQPDKKGILGMMPAYMGGNSSALGIKVVTVFPGNHGTRFDSHQGAIQLFETENGRLLAIIDAGSVTAIRTAAVSALATDLLARNDSTTLTIMGSGTQARMHLESIPKVRESIRRVKVWSRNNEHAREFVNKANTKLDIEAVENPENAVRISDIVCTTTAATAPVLKGEWISRGTHINAIGASVPPFRELDSDAVVKSSFFVDRRQSAIEEAEDFRVPKAEGLIGDDHIKGEIGEILTGKAKGRTSKDEITIFKSAGLAIEDVAAAQLIYKKALSEKAGTWIDFVSQREN